MRTEYLREFVVFSRYLSFTDAAKELFIAQSTLSTILLRSRAVSYTHLRAHETGRNLVCRLLLEKKKKQKTLQKRRIIK